MSNSSLYSCLDDRLFQSQVTAEFWSNPDESTEAYTTAVFTLIFLVIGLPSNIIIIASIIWLRLFKEPAHILLLNLAISDLLYCVLVMPFTIIAGITGEYTLGNNNYTRCKICQTSAVVLIALSLSSLHVLAILSLDRCLFMKLSLHYEIYVTVRRTTAAVVSLWVLCILLVLPPLFEFGDVRYAFPAATCTPRFECGTHSTRNIHFVAVGNLTAHCCNVDNQCVVDLHHSKTPCENL